MWKPSPYMSTARAEFLAVPFAEDQWLLLGGGGPNIATANGCERGEGEQKNLYQGVQDTLQPYNKGVTFEFWPCPTSCRPTGINL